VAELTGLWVGDPPERWAALGFDVTDSYIYLDDVSLRLGAPRRGIAAWSLSGGSGVVAGLPVADVTPPARGSVAATHPNGAVALDHVVVTTPDFDGTAEALAGAGMELKRVVEMRGTRMGFRRLGPAILELVEAPGGVIGFWGLVVTVTDLDALAARLGERLGSIRPAEQPGRRIATLRESAGLTTNVAFMSLAEKVVK
jgi:hypothetical protein